MVGTKISHYKILDKLGEGGRVHRNTPSLLGELK